MTATDRIGKALTIRLTKEGDWWTSQIVEHPGAISQGANVTDAALNVLDALFVVLADDTIA